MGRPCRAQLQSPLERPCSEEGTRQPASGSRNFRSAVVFTSRPHSALDTPSKVKGKLLYPMASNTEKVALLGPGSNTDHS